MTSNTEQPVPRTLITSVKQAREHIGKMVFWDDVSSRYIFMRCGVVDEVSGKNICIDGNWLWRTSLKNLRNYQE